MKGEHEFSKYGDTEAMGKMLERATYEPLFKYRPAHGTKSSESKFVADIFSEKIITEQALWYSNPFDFNDPFEFQVYYERMSRTESKKVANRKRLSKENKQRFVQHSQSMKEGDWQQFIERSRKESMEEIRIGICCFSSNPLNIPMWSYYGQEHKGFCLEFVAKSANQRYFKKGMPLKVDYSEGLIPSKKVFLLKREDHNPSDWRVAYTKSVQWAHEEEVRILIPELPNSRAVKYDKRALQSIIFGCRATKESIEHYTALLKQHGFDHVKLKRAEKDFKEYKLNMVDL